MRESVQKVINDPTISDACKVRILIDEVNFLEKMLEFTRKTRQDAFVKLAIAASIMDAAHTKKYLAALAAQTDTRGGYMPAPHERDTSRGHPLESSLTYWINQSHPERARVPCMAAGE